MRGILLGRERKAQQKRTYSVTVIGMNEMKEYSYNKHTIIARYFEIKVGLCC
jgi:hypothetical protein